MAQLIRAIKQGDEVGIWRQLAQANMDSIVNYQSSDKLETPLFCASMKGNIDVAKNLLEKGAKVESKTSWGATPLHAASERGHLNVVKILVAEGSPLNDQTRFGDTAAHLAAYRGHLKIVKCLVEAGTDLFLKNSERRALLDEASVAEHGKVVRYLECVIFGGDSKPTPWQTPYSRNQDPMMTTNLMQPQNTSPTSSSHHGEKSPVGRSHSYPVLEQDKNRRAQGPTAGVRHKLHDLSFDEVINHPTVRLSLDSNLPQQASGVDSPARNRDGNQWNIRLDPSYENEGHAVPRDRESFPPRRNRDNNHGKVRFQTPYGSTVNATQPNRESYPPGRGIANTQDNTMLEPTSGYAAYATPDNRLSFPPPSARVHEQSYARLEPSYESTANDNPCDRDNSTQRSGSDGICGSASAMEAYACKRECEQLRARSLEKIVTELQCGLSYTQEELARTKSDLKAAKEQIDRVCAAQSNTITHASSNENRRLYLKLRNIPK